MGLDYSPESLQEEIYSKRRRIVLNYREQAATVKKGNIIDMALAFTSMMRVFAKGSKVIIARGLGELCDQLAGVHSPADFERLHRAFCEWFVGTIKTAKKGSRASGPASYGHAAKTLDIALKVYVYYCGQPSAELAERLIPMLHGAVDTPIMKHLKSSFPEAGIKAATIGQVDEGIYTRLQALVTQDIQARYLGQICPVQYDDIMWHELNRQGNRAAMQHPGPKGFTLD